MRGIGHRIVLAVVVVTMVGAAVGGGIGTVAADGSASQETNCSYPITVTDATGTEVTIEEPPETVVTLGPSAAQTMWEIGAKDKVIGLSKYGGYLDGADSRANISGAGRSFVVTEKVIELQPDLVIAPAITQNETVEKLRDAGLTVYRFERANSMEEVKEQTLVTGRLVGACEGASARVAGMNESLSVVEAAVEGESNPKVLYYMGGGYTAGKGTFIDEIIETAGGTNIAAEADITSYQQISSEVVVEQNPDVIILPVAPADESQAMVAVSVPKTAAYNSTDAVQNENYVRLNNNYLNQPAPRTVQSVTELAKALHPEAYEAAQEAQESTTTSTPEPTTTTAEPTTTQPTTEQPTETPTTSPGLGIAGAVFALLFVTLMSRYR